MSPMGFTTSRPAASAGWTSPMMYRAWVEVDRFPVMPSSAARNRSARTPASSCSSRAPNTVTRRSVSGNASRPSAICPAPRGNSASANGLPWAAVRILARVLPVIGTGARSSSRPESSGSSAASANSPQPSTLNTESCGERNPATIRTPGWFNRRPTAPSTCALMLSSQCTSSMTSSTGRVCPAAASRLSNPDASGNTATTESGSPPRTGASIARSASSHPARNSFKAKTT